MLGQTFDNIFKGKQSVFEEMINVDSVLLSKLEQYGIITHTQRTAIEVTLLLFARITVLISLWWRRGVAVECRTRDQKVAGSSLGRALRRKNSGQVSHTYVPDYRSAIRGFNNPRVR